jgi:hypothetical protein
MVGLLGLADVARAGPTTATVYVEILPTSGPSITGAIAELQATDNPASRWARPIGNTPNSAIFELVPPGTYTVIVSLAALSKARLNVRLEPGTILTVRADLQPDGTLSPLRLASSRRISDGIVFDEPLLEALPCGRSPWSLVETADARAVMDRIDGGGLWTGEAPLVGVHGSSWRQASLQMGELDVTDPARTGGVLIQPDTDAVTALVVDAGSLPAEARGPGPVLTVIPQRPGSEWRGTARGEGSPAALQATNARAGTPSIARLDSLTDGSALISGPLVENGPSLLVAGRVTASHRLGRDEPTVLRSDLESLTTHLVVPRSDGSVGIVAAGEWSSHPYAGRMRLRNTSVTEDDTAISAQATWNRALVDGLALSAAGGYVWASLDPAIARSPDEDPAAAAGTVERLRDGPVLALFNPLPGTRQRWALHADAQRNFASPGGRLHTVRAGLSVEHATATIRTVPTALVAETVAGIPARVWSYGTLGAPRWASFEIGGYLADRLALASNLALDAGIRLDVTRGSARGESEAVVWVNASPRINARWQLHGSDRTALFGSYARYAHRLPLDDLAYGDRTGPTGWSYRWNDLNGDRLLQPGEQGVLVAAVGPCCAGSVPNSIDHHLDAPHSDEFVVGIEHRIGGNLRLRLVGTDRRERHLIGSVNSGVGASDYTVILLPDRGADWLGPADDRLLPVYDRHPVSFGQDRYVLTNPPGDDARYQGLDLTLEHRAGRFQMLFGAAAFRADGVGANPGFRAGENDQGVVGEAFEDPNAATYARGRLFFDRAYVIKWSATYRAGRDTTLGVAARYQDGQPFARVVIAPDLQQGAELIQAYERGLTRFTFTLTVDARLEKGFTIGRRRVAFSFVAFNLLNTANEVEEDPVTGSSFRASTAVQPPRAVRLGMHVDF